MSSRFYVYCHDGTGCPTGFVVTGFVVRLLQNVHPVLCLQAW